MALEKQFRLQPRLCLSGLNDPSNSVPTIPANKLNTKFNLKVWDFEKKKITHVQTALTYSESLFSWASTWRPMAVSVRSNQNKTINTKLTTITGGKQEENTNRKWCRACSEPRKGTDWLCLHFWPACPDEPLVISGPARHSAYWKCRWNPPGFWSEMSASAFYVFHAIWCRCSWVVPYSAMGGDIDIHGICRSICYCPTKPFS